MAPAEKGAGSNNMMTSVMLNTTYVSVWIGLRHDLWLPLLLLLSAVP